MTALDLHDDDDDLDDDDDDFDDDDEDDDEDDEDEDEDEEEKPGRCHVRSDSAKGWLLLDFGY